MRTLLKQIFAAKSPTLNQEEYCKLLKTYALDVNQLIANNEHTLATIIPAETLREYEKEKAKKLDSILYLDYLLNY